jgi:hypothetical protein
MESRLFTSSGRQGSGRNTGSDRPYRCDNRTENLMIRTIFDLLFHGYLPAFIPKDLKKMSGYKSPKKGDEPEPVQANEPHADDPLRPQPVNFPKLITARCTVNWLPLQSAIPVQRGIL